MSYRSEPWFAGSINGGKTNELLLAPGQVEGNFLVRESSSSPGSFVLSVRVGSKVRNFKINKTASNFFYMTEGIEYPALEALISIAMDPNKFGRDGVNDLELKNPYKGDTRPAKAAQTPGLTLPGLSLPGAAPPSLPHRPMSLAPLPGTGPPSLPSRPASMSMPPPLPETPRPTPTIVDSTPSPKSAGAKKKSVFSFFGGGGSGPAMPEVPEVPEAGAEVVDLITEETYSAIEDDDNEALPPNPPPSRRIAPEAPAAVTRPGSSYMQMSMTAENPMFGATDVPSRPNAVDLDGAEIYSAVDDDDDELDDYENADEAPSGADPGDSDGKPSRPAKEKKPKKPKKERVPRTAGGPNGTELPEEDKVLASATCDTGRLTFWQLVLCVLTFGVYYLYHLCRKPEGDLSIKVTRNRVILEEYVYEQGIRYRGAYSYPLSSLAYFRHESSRPQLLFPGGDVLELHFNQLPQKVHDSEYASCCHKCTSLLCSFCMLRSGVYFVERMSKSLLRLPALQQMQIVNSWGPCSACYEGALALLRRLSKSSSSTSSACAAAGPMCAASSSACFIGCRGTSVIAPRMLTGPAANTMRLRVRSADADGFAAVRDVANQLVANHPLGTVVDEPATISGWAWQHDKEETKHLEYTRLIHPALNAEDRETVLLNKSLVTFKDDERVVAVFPRHGYATSLDIVLCVLTFGLYYLFELRFKLRHDAALVVTDRRVLSLTFLPTIVGANSPTLDHFRNESWFIPRIRTTEMSTEQPLLPCLRPCSSVRLAVVLDLGGNNKLAIVDAQKARDVGEEDMVERLFHIFSRHQSLDRSPVLHSEKKFGTMDTSTPIPLGALLQGETVLGNHSVTPSLSPAAFLCWVLSLGLLPRHKLSLVLTSHRMGIAVTSTTWKGRISKTIQIVPYHMVSGVLVATVKRLPECGCFLLQNKLCFCCIRRAHSPVYGQVGVQARFTIANAEPAGFHFGLLYHQRTLFDPTAKELHGRLLEIQRYVAERGGGFICGMPASCVIDMQPLLHTNGHAGGAQAALALGFGFADESNSDPPLPDRPSLPPKPGSGSEAPIITTLDSYS